MKYILMMNTPGGGAYQVASWPREDLARHLEFMKSFAKKLSASGELAAAEGLAGPDQAKRVRAGADGTPVTDGVFPESKEFLAYDGAANQPGSDQGVRHPRRHQRRVIMITATLESSALAVHQSAPRRVVRRVGPVLVGLVTIFATSTATDVVLHQTGVFPPPGATGMTHALFILAFSYRAVFDVFGCYLTARLAPARPMLHAMILGAIGLVLSILGGIAMWDPTFAWYPILLAASALPSGWLGGHLAARQAARAHRGALTRPADLEG